MDRTYRMQRADDTRQAESPCSIYLTKVPQKHPLNYDLNCCVNCRVNDCVN